MSNVRLAGDVSGTGSVTIASPNTNSTRTIALPDADGTFAVANSSGNITATTFTGSFATTNWTVAESAGKLVFSYGGSAKFSIDSSGNMIVTGNVTGYGTP